MQLRPIFKSSRRAASDDSGPPTCLAKKNPSDLHVPDGRSCTVCHVRDDAPDPAIPGRTVLWRPGKVCLYCYKTIRSNYYPKYTTKGVIVLIGGADNKDECDKYYALRSHCVEGIKASQDPDAYIPWGEGRKKLDHILDSSWVWEGPKDKYIPWPEYVATHGDPRTNGLGHQTGKNPNGIFCVIVPESNVMTRKREIKDTMRLKRTLAQADEDSDPQNGMEDRWKQLQGVSLLDGTGVDTTSAVPAQATGTTLASLLGWSVGASGVSSVMPSPAQPYRHTQFQQSERHEQSAASSTDDFSDSFKPLFDGMGHTGANSALTATPPKLAPQARLDVPVPVPVAKKARSEAVSPSGIATAGKKKVGRPGRDIPDTIRKAISQFSGCKEDPQDGDYRLFFGDQQQSQMRFLAKLKKDHEGYMNKIEDEVELGVRMQEQKKLNAVVDIITSFSKSKGQSCTAFKAAHARIVQFLQAGTRVDLAMPVPVKHLLFDADIQEATPSRFWELIGDEQLREIGFKEIEHEQHQVITRACVTHVEWVCVHVRSAILRAIVNMTASGRLRRARIIDAGQFS